MITLRFDPRVSLIRLRVVLESRYQRDAILVLDSGASITAITPQLAEAIGCEPARSTADFPIFTASGSARVHCLNLTSISLYDECIAPVSALCVSLSSRLGADGLLGLNFLRHFKIGLDFEVGNLTFDRIKEIRS